MKINKYLSIIALGALAFSSCSKDFNDQFEGLDKKTEITDVKKKGVEYTLTSGNYKSIAELEANLAIAERDGEEDLLAAINTERGFHSKDDAAKYIPAFISDVSTWRYLSAGSKLQVNYTLFNEIPEDIAAMRSMKNYTLKTEDYAAVAGDAEAWYATPETEANIASVLPTDGYAEGDYVAVSYKYFEGASGGGSVPAPAPAEFAYSDVIGSLKTDSGAVTIKGYVAAVGTQGFIVLDKSGALYIYRPETYPEVGSNVTVSGTVGNYGNGLQLVAGATVTEETSDLVLYNDAPISIDAATIDELTSRTEAAGAIYATMTGQLTISGSNNSTYYNLIIDGVSEKQGSLVYPSEAIQAQIADGQTITVNGYFVYSSSGNKYANMVVASVGEESLAYVPVQFPYGNGKYMIVAEQDGAYIAAGAATQQGTAAPYYGYPSGVEVAAEGGMIAADVDETTVWSIEPASEDTFYIKNDSDSYYYYLTTYASFSLAEEADAGNESFKYSFGKDAEGIYKIMNIGAGKWWQYTTYKTYGAYNSQQNGSANPQLYRLASVSAANAAAVSSYAAKTAVTRANTVEDKYAVYKYNGSAFEPADMTVVQPADYAAMGHSNGFDSDSDDDATLLPKYLKTKYPYASAGEVVYVSYRKGGEWTTDEYTFDGSDWNVTEYTVTANSRFRKMSDGNWTFDSTFEIDFSADGGGAQDFKDFLQYCANWVYDNIDVKLGAPERDNAGVILSTEAITVAGEKPAGTFFVSSYGNNEWYAGTYAYYGEMNWNAFNAETQFKAAAEVMDLDPSIDLDLGIDISEVVNETYEKTAIVKAMQMNAAKVFKHVLEAMYPDFTPDDYSAIVLSVWNYYEREDHNVKKAAYAYTFNVVDTGKFEFDEESFGLAE